jgi:hypothetical protein
MEGQRTSMKRFDAGFGLDLALLVVLFVASLGVRWQYAREVVFPPFDASAFFLSTAANVVEGRRLEIDVLWSYQVPFPAVTHPSHEHQMPVTTAAVAAAFALQRVFSGAWEVTLDVGQWAGLILGSLLAPLTYLFGRRALPRAKGNRWISLGAALLIVVNGTLAYQSATASSSAPFAFLAAGALAVAVRQPGERGGYLGAGMLVALAYLTRSDGLLLLLAIPLAWWLLPMPARAAVDLPDTPAGRLAWDKWPRQKGGRNDQPLFLGPGLRHLVDFGVAFALIVAPWLVRNYLAFGTPLPSSLLAQAWLGDYVDNFNYLAHPTPQTWLAQTWSVLLDQRIQALAHSSQVLLLGTYPWGVLALPGLWLLRREWSLFPALVYGLLLLFGTALLFPISVLSGLFFRSVGALMPFLALAAVYSIYRGSQLLGRQPRLATTIGATVTVALLLLSAWQVVQTLPDVRERSLVEKSRLEAAAAWLSDNTAPAAVVMTDATHQLNYASGHPTIALPGNEPSDSAWQAAERYGASYLIVTQEFGLYPGILNSQPDPRFRLVAEIEGSQIYEIGGGQR